MDLGLPLPFPQVKAATAHAAFVLLDIDNELPETMDTRANLITTSLRMHAASAGRRDLPLFTQVCARWVGGWVVKSHC